MLSNTLFVRLALIVHVSRRLLPEKRKSLLAASSPREPTLINKIRVTRSKLSFISQGAKRWPRDLHQARVQMGLLARFCMKPAARSVWC